MRFRPRKVFPSLFLRLPISVANRKAGLSTDDAICLNGDTPCMVAEGEAGNKKITTPRIEMLR